MGRPRSKRHSDHTIYVWAKYYVDKNTTLREVGAEFGVSFHTVYWCFIHRLINIDPELYVKCIMQLSDNKELRGMRKDRR